MRKIPKETVFFPNPSSAKKKALGLTFFVCIVEKLSSPREEIPLTIAWILIVFFLLYIAILTGIKMQLNKARSDFKHLESLVDNPNYIPIQVKVFKANYLSKIYAVINGRYQRKAIDQSGKLYTTFFNDLLGEDFDAELYQINPKNFFSSPSFVIPKLM